MLFRGLETVSYRCYLRNTNPGYNPRRTDGTGTHSYLYRIHSCLYQRFRPSLVATLPAISSQSGKLDFVFLTASITPAECPCEVSITTTSTPALSKASTLSSLSMIPTAAPTLNLPSESLQAFGYFFIFSISFMVMSPFRLYFHQQQGAFYPVFMQYLL